MLDKLGQEPIVAHGAERRLALVETPGGARWEALQPLLDEVGYLLRTGRQVSGDVVGRPSFTCSARGRGCFDKGGQDCSTFGHTYRTTDPRGM